MADQTNPRFMTQEEATGGASGLAAWEKRVGALSSPANNSPVVPPAGGTGGALPASSYTDSGTMASFLGSMTDTTNANLKSLQNIGQQLPQLGENDVMIRAQADKNKAGITSMYDSTRELVDIQSQQGNQQLARFGEMLSAPDYQIKNKIQEYGNQVQVFHKQVNATLERLTTDEQNALDQQDMNAYNQIRTEKNDWINMQRGMIQDQTNLMNNAFSQLMTGMSFQRQQTIDTKNNASNQLSYFQSAYGGKPFDSMAPQDQKTVIDSAAVLGISPDMVKNMMQTPQAAHYISKPGAIYVLDRSGNILRTITTPGDNSSAGTTGTEAATYFKNYGGTLSGGTASATAEARRQVNNFAKTAVGSQVMVARNKAISDAKSVTNANGPLTYDNMAQWRKTEADTFASQILADPKKVGAILGVSPGPNFKPSQQQADAITALVEAQHDEWLPDTYLSVQIQKANNPMAGMDFGGGSSPAVNVNTDQTTSDFGAGTGTGSSFRQY